MPTPPPLSIFNTSLLNVSVVINNGPQLNIAGASPVNQLQPAQQSAPFTFGAPSPGSFGFGTNQVTVIWGGSFEPTTLAISIQPNQMWTSPALYLFMSSGQGCAWTLLNNGQLVAQSGS